MKRYAAVAIVCAFLVAGLLLVAHGDGEPESGGDVGVARVGDGGSTEEEPEAGQAGAVSTEPKAGMEKLALDLPEPVFEGTPTNFRDVRLSDDIGESRGDVYVPEGTELLSQGKRVTSSWDLPIIGELDYITDGSKEPHDGNYVSLGPGKQWVQVDLEDTYRIAAIVLWHFHLRARVYHDVVVQVSTDKDFEEDVTTVFNNDYDNSLGFGIGDNWEYVETNEGKLIDGGDAKGRYVRLYSKGNTSNEMNHYIEVAVYGRPAK